MTNQRTNGNAVFNRFRSISLMGVLAATLAGLGGCRTEAGTDAGIGAMLGAATGAIIGHNVHGQTAEGAAIGALGGAFGGYILGNETDKHRQQRGCADYSY